MQNRMMITGAGSGLGREIALRWAREGWQLALSDVSEPGLQETLKLVREAGGDGFIQRCDVRDYSQLTAFAQACEEKLGGIDVIVNNAGVASGGFFSELSLEDWDWQIAINLMGVVKGCKAFLPLLEKSKGKIINIASMAALMQGPAMSNYNVAKAGVVALSESLLIELAQQEIGVHVVCPSFFQTNLLDSFRGPTPAMKAQVGKLLESSPITADRHCRLHLSAGRRRRIHDSASRTGPHGLGAQAEEPAIALRRNDRHGRQNARQGQTNRRLNLPVRNTVVRVAAIGHPRETFACSITCGFSSPRCLKSPAALPSGCGCARVKAPGGSCRRCSA